jgi:peroxiredoxin Q/BCP
LLSDEGSKVRKEWGVPGDFFGSFPGRETYVIDKNGVVQLIYNNQFQPEKYIDETLKLRSKAFKAAIWMLSFLLEHQKSVI